MHAVSSLTEKIGEFEPVMPSEYDKHLAIWALTVIKTNVQEYHYAISRAYCCSVIFNKSWPRHLLVAMSSCKIEENVPSLSGSGKMEANAFLAS